jgi:hypothetical protein
MNDNGRIVMGVTSAILIAIAAAMLVATAALAWLFGTQRDGDGYVTSPTVSVSSDGYAIASADIDIEDIPAGWIPSNLLGTLRVQAESETDSDLFIGVGPLEDVQAFLDDVEHSDVVRVGGSLGAMFGATSDVSYVTQPGSRTPEPPASQEFWMATTEGPGLRSLEWEPQTGAWKLVVMNADADAGIDISASIGVNHPWLPVGMVVVGVITLLIGALAVVTVVFALRRRSAPVVEVSGERELERVSS